VKFRDDHPDYPGMVGTVTGDLTMPGGEPMVSVVLDGVPATADEIEPFEGEGQALAQHYRDVMLAEPNLSEKDQRVILDLLARDGSQPWPGGNTDLDGRPIIPTAQTNADGAE
jgi:hypothetical protein